jgi:hypothetical protein
VRAYLKKKKKIWQKYLMPTDMRLDKEVRISPYNGIKYEYF